MYIFLILATLVVVATITQGVIKLYKREMVDAEKIKKSIRINLIAIVPILTGLIITCIPEVVHAAGAGDSVLGLGYIAAALSTGLAAIGAGIAVAAVGSSALGAVSEDPEILGKTLIFVGLAEGIAIYGLIISIMILGKL